ncbi:hypothetical protein ACFXGA_27050 [Actinosynnema sp. NPDC059335]|uniref:hypothetical protein n=1 Tax=Actinosynnema sp. NPDC059335 TaxID=3346804 RepID=UPI00366D28E3
MTTTAEARAQAAYDANAHDAATVLAGAIVSLELAGRREVALHLADALDLQMLTRVNGLLMETIPPTLRDAVRDRVARGGRPQPDVVGGPSRAWSDRVREALESVLGEYAPGVDMDVLTCDDAYKNLVSRIMDRCLDDDVDPIDVLRRLDPRTIAASENMTSAAAWLTAQVRDLPDLHA